MRTPALVVAALAAGLVLAGCGTPPHYTLTKTESCFRQAGATIVAPKNDFVAQSATAGAFRVELHGAKGNAVTLSFGETANDAKGIADGYVRFHAKNVGISDILALDKNVVLLWKEHPSQADLNEVTSCLK